MSIAEQIATPTPAARARRSGAPLRPAPVRRPASAVLRILALVMVTALGVALFAGSVAIAIMAVAANMGG